jgi:hypothetical protein
MWRERDRERERERKREIHCKKYLFIYFLFLGFFFQICEIDDLAIFKFGTFSIAYILEFLKQ